MDSDDPLPSTVDPEVRAHVYSLVSALGGTSASEDGRYVLGDDALACLKDLKKWLKLHDEKANRLDVARCLAEANLVNGDLLEILAGWPEEATGDRLRSKIALSCLELLVPLTWPIEKDELQMTKNHHRHIPYLQLAQISYKRAILEHDSAMILRTAIRIGLPSMALPMSERTPRDEGIIKLLLYFFRNIAMITTPKYLSTVDEDSQVSRSSTIGAFHSQDVFALILTLSSNMGEDFNTQDVVILELLFHLLKGISVEKLFMDDDQLESNISDELRGLLAKEAAMHRNYAKNAPTRHNRFGTMIWVKRDDARVSTVSGQDNLTDNQRTLLKMDQSKKWNKPKSRGKDTEQSSERFDILVSLDASSSKQIRAFVEEFLDSSFNPLFNHIRKALEREADRVLEVHTQQFFYLVSWFLEAERARRKSKRQADAKNKKLEEVTEADSYGLIASVLNQETFVALNRFMQDRLDMKAWQEINAGMRCFTQILLTVQEMAESPLEEDQEIAENIQNRIFYEETTHDRIIAILKGYKDQGFGYLDACTELSHVFLRMLERYSKENTDLHIRSRRRARKKTALKIGREPSNEADDQDSEAEEIAEAHRVSKERKFDFTRFSSKFLTQSCIDTFVAFIKYYSDLSSGQLKRAHRFFYRVAFKQELSVMLFRIDIFMLFNKMMKGPDGLNSASQMYREWDELVKHLIKKLIKKFNQRPELAVEMLFSKINSTVFYLEYGYEKQTPSSKPRAPATLEVKGAMTKEEQIGVAVAVLFDNQLDSIDWVRSLLASAITERQSWEAEAAARAIVGDAKAKGAARDESESASKAPSIIVRPDSEERRIAIFKDNKLRLLMSLVGMERIGIDDEPNATWIIPSALSSQDLEESFKMVEKHRNNPILQYGDDNDIIAAEDMLRRKPVIKPRRAEYDDDSDGDGIDSDVDEDFLFPAGGPTKRKADALDELKRKRRKRRVEGSGDEGDLNEQALDARRKARKLADLEKRRKIKSSDLVHDSDDETDDERDREFFAREEQRRKGNAGKLLQALKVAKVEDQIVNVVPKRGKRKLGSDIVQTGKKRKIQKTASQPTSGNDTANNASDSDGSLSAPKRGTSEMSEHEASDTSLSSPLPTSPEKSLGEIAQTGDPAPVSIASKFSTVVLDDGEGDEEAPPIPPVRRRARAAVFEDSDSE